MPAGGGAAPVAAAAAPAGGAAPAKGKVEFFIFWWTILTILWILQLRKRKRRRRRKNPKRRMMTWVSVSLTKPFISVFLTVDSCGKYILKCQIESYLLLLVRFTLKLNDFLGTVWADLALVKNTGMSCFNLLLWYCNDESLFTIFRLKLCDGIFFYLMHNFSKKNSAA